MTFETRHTITSNESAQESTCKDEKNEAIRSCIAQEMLKISVIVNQGCLYQTCRNWGAQNLINICRFSEKNKTNSERTADVWTNTNNSGFRWSPLTSKPSNNIRIWHISSLKIAWCGMRLCNRQRKLGKCSRASSASQASGMKTFQQNMVEHCLTWNNYFT